MQGEENREHNIPINTFEDVLIARKKARELMDYHKFSTLDQTKFITAISELLRNVIIHAGSGKFQLSISETGGTFLVKCIVSDKGPGIKDINKALKEGYSSVGSLGLGLSGAKNLSDEFSITSSPETGTIVQIIKWR